jgi:hypothetical protein
MLTVERGRRYRGVYQPDPTQPGHLVEGLILGDKAHGADWEHGIAWLLSDDATFYPVARTSLATPQT